MLHANKGPVSVIFNEGQSDQVVVTWLNQSLTSRALIGSDVLTKCEKKKTGVKTHPGGSLVCKVVVFFLFGPKIALFFFF